MIDCHLRPRLFLLACFISILLIASSSGAATPYVSVSIVADTASIEPGKPFRLGLLYRIDQHWHIYGPVRTEFGLPTTVKFELPPGFVAGEVQYPPTKRYIDAGVESFGYENEVLLFATIRPPENLPTGSPVTLKASSTWLVCKTDGQCIPGRQSLQLDLPLGPATPSAQAPLFDRYAALIKPSAPASAPTEPRPATSPNEQSASAEKGAFSFISESSTAQRRSPWLMLLFAFLGGIILNVMPCVLPVLSLKIMGFVQQAGDDRSRTLSLGIVFTIGVLVSFLALATVVVALQGAGQQLGWGFQFQEPRFLVFMSAIILAFCLSLFGVFHINLPGQAMQGAYSLQSRQGFVGSFFSGVLATALATPCTAPLLGPALGYAFTQPAHWVYLFFLMIGAGLSAPYLLLAAFPAWLRILPRPGRWMETFKEFMGFLLLATVVWLLWLFGKTAGGAEGIIALLAFLVAVALGSWVIGRGVTPVSSRAKRRFSMVVAVLIVAAGYMWFPERHVRWLKNAGASVSNSPSASSDGRWEPFTVERVEELVATNKTVFVDFTADWCVTCKVNEKAVLAHPSVVKSFEEKDVALLKADYTHQPPELTRIIRSFGRAGVPLYLLFPAGDAANPIVLPEALTPAIVLNALQRTNPR